MVEQTYQRFADQGTMLELRALTVGQAYGWRSKASMRTASRRSARRCRFVNQSLVAMSGSGLPISYTKRSFRTWQ